MRRGRWAGVVLALGVATGCLDAEQKDLMDALGHRDALVRWKALSSLVALQRGRGDEHELQRLLERVARRGKDPALVAQARLALADVHLRQQRPLRALDQVRALQASSAPEEWKQRAARVQVSALRAAGDTEAARHALEGLLATATGEEGADMRFQLAEVAIAAGDRAVARRLLEEIVSDERVVAELMRLARGRLLQLDRSPGPAFPDVRAATAALMAAFEDPNGAELAALMDLRRFEAGPLGTDPDARDDSWLKRLVAASAVEDSRPHILSPPPRIEEPSRVLLMSHGWMWEGVTHADAWLDLSKDADGWRWVGMRFVAPQGRRAARRSTTPVAAAPRGLGSGGAACAAPPGAPPERQPLRFDLPAPWATGESMLVGTWFLANPSPVVGGACTDLVGWPGQYYMQGNHGVTGGENYAFDAIHWGTTLGVCPFWLPPFVVPCPWPWPKTGNTAVAVADGRVTSISSSTHGVTVAHLDWRGRETDYRSSYLHLDPVEVFEGQFVARGMPLGRVGKYGTAEPHLHFHLRWCDRGADGDDRCDANEWRPAMPSPLGGVTLDWCGARHCITSRNGNTFEDRDGDGVMDTFDNCPAVANGYVSGPDGLMQLDSDGDGWGDACACWEDTQCTDGWFCDRSGGGPPRCARPACLSNADCVRPSRCEGRGAGAYCTDPGQPPLDCSGVNVLCLIGYEEPDCSWTLHAPEPPIEDPCPHGRRHPASSQESACLSRTLELQSHIGCGLTSRPRRR